MGLSISEVEHVARLARLELSESEKEKFTNQLNGILQFVETLNQLDTEAVEPTAHAVPITNVFRSDVVKASLDPELALQNAPDRSDNFFRVPKVLEDE